MKKLTLSILITSLMTVMANPSEYRNFTNQTGKTIYARIIQYDNAGERVQLELKTHKKAWIQLSDLSEANQTYIRNQNKASLGSTESEKKSESAIEHLSKKEMFQNYKSMEYGLIKPEPYDAKKKYPLVLCLHGGCPTGGNKKKKSKRKIQTFELTEKVRGENPCFVLIPQAKKLWWDGGKNDSPIEEILSFIDDELLEKFSIDKNRLYVVGNSDGGTAILHIQAWYPDTFAAAIPLSGWLKKDESTRKMAKSNTAVWWFAGTDDKIAPWSFTERVLDNYKQAKGNLKLTVVEVNGGHSAPNRVYKALCNGRSVEGTRLITTSLHCDATTINPIEWMFKQSLR